MEKDMKPALKVSVLAAAILVLAGCKEESTSKTTAVAPATKVEQVSGANSTTSNFANANDKEAYAIGSSLAQYLKANLDQQKALGLDLNRDMVLAGVNDVFSGKDRLTPVETEQALKELDQRVSKLVTEKAQADAEKNITAGKAFSEKFAKEPGVITTKSGLMYKIETKGTGPKPTSTDTVKVQYKGELVDGKVFDSSYKRNQPAVFPLNQVIPGWTEGLQLMPVGSKFEFVIPPQLAYGSQANPSIPANSTLVFQVELLAIQKPNATPALEVQAQSAAATTK
jgi:FKBP-type peptidyl-prolyl cis-trans isomerase FkpA